MAFAGFGLFAFGIPSFITNGDDPTMGPDAFLPRVPAGFGLAFVGVVVGNLAVMLSRPRR